MAQHHLLIDTNVLLSFYAFTQDDLTRLEKLVKWAESRDTEVLTTDQIKAEYLRNRGGKIAESVKQLLSQRLDFQFPRLCDPYPEADQLRGLAREYSQLHRDLITKINQETQAKQLRADKILDTFFSKAATLATTDAILERARLRFECGNPPGKRGSLGDAINWEALLDHAPKGAVTVVTDDADYYSVFDSSQPHEFLLAEWKEQVGGDIAFVRHLSDLPDLPAEALPLDDKNDERDLLIQELLQSDSFHITHRAIARIARHDLTTRQVKDLVDALDNWQVGGILGDPDVNEFYRDLESRYGGALTGQDAIQLSQALRDAEADK